MIQLNFNLTAINHLSKLIWYFETHATYRFECLNLNEMSEQQVAGKLRERRRKRDGDKSQTLTEFGIQKYVTFYYNSLIFIHCAMSFL